MGPHSPTDETFNAGGPKTCDNDSVKVRYCPTPTPTPPCHRGNCTGSVQSEFELSHSMPLCPRSVDYCTFPRTGCPDFPPYMYNWEDQGCCNKPYSPIIVDVLGDGFRLTDNTAGVNFDLNSVGVRERLS